MPGLLDFGDTEEEKRQNGGLLAALAGLGILSNNGPNTPAGQAIAGGALSGVNSFAQMQQKQAADQLRKAQMQMAQERMIPNSVREYEYAKSQGYQGSFEDYRNQVMGRNEVPANVREWEYFNKLPKEDQARYLTMKRQLNPINLGGSVIQPNPAVPGGPPIATYEKTPPPEQMPEFKGAQAGAAAAGTAAGARGAGASPGQKAIDDAFGKEYAAMVAAGGMADPEKNLSQLEAIRGRLAASESGKSNENLTGPVVGKVPDIIKNFTNPSSVDVKQQVEDVVQRNLRTILGAQFTENEGTRLIERAYNPSLDEKTNGQRLDRLIGALRKGLQAKVDAAKYFEEHGTLFGYKGAKQFTMSDIEREAGLTPNSSASGASGGWSARRAD